MQATHSRKGTPSPPLLSNLRLSSCLLPPPFSNTSRKLDLHRQSWRLGVIPDRRRLYARELGENDHLGRLRRPNDRTSSCIVGFDCFITSFGHLRLCREEQGGVVGLGGVCFVLVFVFVCCHASRPDSDKGFSHNQGCMPALPRSCLVRRRSIALSLSSNNCPQTIPPTP